MRLREFVPDDAQYIVKWVKNEREFRLWSADRFGDYPVLPDRVAAHHEVCSRSGSFFPLTFVDDNNNVVGHLILRYTDEARTELRLGFVIVDSSLRGQGLGRNMLELAKVYAVEVLYAKSLSLGVFENNTAALNCYKSVGFYEVNNGEEFFDVLGEQWRCIEMRMDIA